MQNSLDNLFVQEWSTEVNYSEYFSQCAPALCIYTKTDHNNLSYTITLLLSLYGGLTIILRILTPLLVKISLQLKHRSLNHNASR